MADWSPSANGTESGLRDLCSDLFGRRSTRALRVVMSGAFDRLGTPTDAGH